MQTAILRSIALVTIGNAALAGRDVSSFWPRSDLLRFYKEIIFLIPDGAGGYKPVAPDPNAWFAKLGALGCRGLRLHAAPMQQHEGERPQSERMTVGLVGGGPRWLIEAVYAERSELWEGHDRTGDRDDPQQRVWLGAYLMLGETDTLDKEAVRGVAAATAPVRSGLLELAGLAWELPGAAHFADVFNNGSAAFDDAAPPYPGLDFLDLTMLEPAARRLLIASVHGWAFGANGSWNDVIVPPELRARYETGSENLFRAMQRAALAVANSTYRD